MGLKAGDVCYIRARNGALMRKGKELSSDKLQELPARTTVKVVGQSVVVGDAERIEVECAGARGWVSTKVLSEPQTSNGGDKIQTTLHYREGDEPTRHHSLKLTIPPRGHGQGAAPQALPSVLRQLLEEAPFPHTRCGDS